MRNKIYQLLEAAVSPLGYKLCRSDVASAMIGKIDYPILLIGGVEAVGKAKSESLAVAYNISANMLVINDMCDVAKVELYGDLERDARLVVATLAESDEVLTAQLTKAHPLATTKSHRADLALELKLYIELFDC